MSQGPKTPADPTAANDAIPPEPSPASPERLFLHEAGWQIALKLGSEREFCYLMAPGQDYYHRLYAGEIYLHRGDEKLCVACARRRHLLTNSARQLQRESILSSANLDPNSPEYDLAPVETGEDD